MALSTSLVAYWSLEEASGTRVDATGRGNDLTPNGSSLPGNTTGKVANAIQLSQVNVQYLSIADNTDLSTGDIDFTLACWCYIDNLSTRVMMAKWNDDVNQREYFLATVSSRFNLYVSSNGSAQTNIAANTLGVPATATWYFVVAWHDSVANTLNICVNNGAVDSTSYSSGVFDSTAGFKIGANRASAVNLWDGRIDEAAMWKRVLTGAEITDLYNAGSGRDYAYISTTPKSDLIPPPRMPMAILAR